MVLTLLTVAAATSAAASPPTVELQQGWVRWLPPTVPNTALFGVLVNPTDHPVRLVGGGTTVAKRCAPMKTVRKDTGSASGPVMEMVTVDALVVPAHGRLVLEPGGDHLMIMGLRKALVVGEPIQLTLTFEGAEPLTVSVPVVRK
ncbi:MAG: copper chaperone PCu(A)C [Deinococcales bacterium]